MIGEVELLCRFSCEAFGRARENRVEAGSRRWRLGYGDHDERRIQRLRKISRPLERSPCGLALIEADDDRLHSQVPADA